MNFKNSKKLPISKMSIEQLEKEVKDNHLVANFMLAIWVIFGVGVGIQALTNELWGWFPHLDLSLALPMFLFIGIVPVGYEALAVLAKIELRFRKLEAE